MSSTKPRSFYLRKGGEITEVLGSAELARMAQAGEITPETPVAASPEGPWRPAGQVKGLFRAAESRRQPSPPEQAAERSEPSAISDAHGDGAVSSRQSAVVGPVDEGEADWSEMMLQAAREEAQAEGMPQTPPTPTLPRTPADEYALHSGIAGILYFLAFLCIVAGFASALVLYALPPYMRVALAVQGVVVGMLFAGLGRVVYVLEDIARWSREMAESLGDR